MMGQGMGEIGSFVGREPTLSVGDIEEEDGGGGGAFIRRCRGSGWEVLGQKMGECKAYLRRKRSGGWENAECLYEGNGAEDGKERSDCSILWERRMGGIGSFIRRQRSGGWEGTNRLYEGNGAGDGREWIVCIVR